MNTRTHYEDPLGANRYRLQVEAEVGAIEQEQRSGRSQIAKSSGARTPRATHFFSSYGKHGEDSTWTRWQQIPQCSWRRSRRLS